MSHTHEKSFDDAESAKAIIETIDYAAGFPQGEPVPIVVTLSDEEWNAVKALLQVGLIINSTEGMAYMPAWLAEQAHSAWHDIHQQVGHALGMLAYNSHEDPRDEGDTNDEA